MIRFLSLLTIALSASMASASTAPTTLVTCQTRGGWYVEVTQAEPGGKLTLENYKVVDQTTYPSQSGFKKVYSYSEKVNVLTSPGNSTVYYGSSTQLTIPHGRPSASVFVRILRDGKVVTHPYSCFYHLF